MRKMHVRLQYYMHNAQRVESTLKLSHLLSLIHNIRLICRISILVTSVHAHPFDTSHFPSCNFIETVTLLMYLSNFFFFFSVAPMPISPPSRVESDAQAGRELNAMKLLVSRFRAEA